MRYELFIGLRYLQARRRETFISFITLISILGVMIGVMTLNVVMAVMTGFEEVLRDRLLGINAHVALVKSGSYLTEYQELIEQVMEDQGVLAATPLVYGQVMVSSGARVSGVVVRGVDPDRVSGVVDIQRYIKQGSLEGLKTPLVVEIEGRSMSLPGVILGVRLAGQIGAMVATPCNWSRPWGPPRPWASFQRLGALPWWGSLTQGCTSTTPLWFTRAWPRPSASSSWETR